MRSLGERIRKENRKQNLTLEPLPPSTNLPKKILSRMKRDAAPSPISNYGRMGQVSNICNMGDNICAPAGLPNSKRGMG
jgi:hypothetical protein